MWDVLRGVVDALGVGLAVLCALGALLVLWVMIRYVPRIWRAGRVASAENSSWPTTQGVLLAEGYGYAASGLSTELHHRTDGLPVGEDPPSSRRSEFSLPYVAYSFELDGVEYTGTDSIKAPSGSTVGGPITVTYNPDDPSENRANRGKHRRFWVWALLCVVVLAVLGTCGVLFGIMAFEGFQRAFS